LRSDLTSSLLGLANCRRPRTSRSKTASACASVPRCAGRRYRSPRLRSLVPQQPRGCRYGARGTVLEQYRQTALDEFNRINPQTLFSSPLKRRTRALYGHLAPRGKRSLQRSPLRLPANDRSPCAAAAGATARRLQKAARRRTDERCAVHSVHSACALRGSRRAGAATPTRVRSRASAIHR
jgi:hypothetical protein